MSVASEQRVRVFPFQHKGERLHAALVTKSAPSLEAPKIIRAFGARYRVNAEMAGGERLESLLSGEGATTVITELGTQRHVVEDTYIVHPRTTDYDLEHQRLPRELRLIRTRARKRYDITFSIPEEVDARIRRELRDNTGRGKAMRSALEIGTFVFVARGITSNEISIDVEEPIRENGVYNIRTRMTPKSDRIHEKIDYPIVSGRYGLDTNGIPSLPSSGRIRRRAEFFTMPAGAGYIGPISRVLGDTDRVYANLHPADPVTVFAIVPEKELPLLVGPELSREYFQAVGSLPRGSSLF
ncbi:hypothetical protein HZC07_04450 [Candidatus Micrarchaeota archaeon]|nr:hypothetical protein [Candidatus Micrarchaeota archaeon]